MPCKGENLLLISLLASILQQGDCSPIRQRRQSDILPYSPILLQPSASFYDSNDIDKSTGVERESQLSINDFYYAKIITKDGMPQDLFDKQAMFQGDIYGTCF